MRTILLVQSEYLFLLVFVMGRRVWQTKGFFSLTALHQFEPASIGLCRRLAHPLGRYQRAALPGFELSREREGTRAHPLYRNGRRI